MWHPEHSSCEFTSLPQPRYQHSAALVNTEQCEHHYIHLYNATNVLLVDLIPKVGEKVVVCGGQPLTSRLSCLVLEGDDPGGQLKTPIIPVKKVQGGDNMPYFRPHTVEDLRRSWILDHTHILITAGSHFSCLYTKKSWVTTSYQVSGASLTLLGGSLNPQGVLEVHLSS